MNEPVRSIYLVLCFNPNAPGTKPRDIARSATFVQDFIQTNEGFDFAEKYCVRAGNLLYGEYMKERTRRIFSKVSGDGGLTL